MVDHAALDEGVIEGWTLRLTPEGTPTDDDDDAGTGGTFAGAGDLDIPDNDETGIRSTATIPEGTTGASVQVALNITHTYIGDLVVELAAPSGDRWTLHDRDGGSADDINRVIPLDPAPQGALEGEWTLTIADRAGRDVGKLESWSITIQ